MDIETAMKYLVNEHHIEDSKQNRKLVLQNWSRCSDIAKNESGYSFCCGTDVFTDGRTHQDFMDGMLITYFQIQ